MFTTSFVNYPFPVRWTVLPNGFTVIAIENGSKLVQSEICFRVGALDDRDQAGKSISTLSHYLEHLLFQGPARQGVHPKLRQLLLRGVTGNASTGYDGTRYFLRGLATELEAMLTALASICFEPEITAESVEAERGPITEESAESQLKSRSEHVLAKQLYPQAEALHGPPCGSEPAIAAVTSEDLRRHHAAHYRPENAALIVEGGVTSDAVLALLGKIPILGSGPASEPLPAKPEILLTGSSATVEDKTVTDRVSLAYPNVPGGSDRLIMPFVMGYLANGNFGPLHLALRTHGSLAYRIKASAHDWRRPRVEFTVPVNRRNFGLVHDRIQAVLAETADGTVSQDSFDFIKARQLIRFIARNETRDVPQFIEDFRYRWLSGYLADDDLELVLARIEPADVVRLVGQCLQPEAGRTIRIVRSR